MDFTDCINERTSNMYIPSYQYQITYRMVSAGSTTRNYRCLRGWGEMRQSRISPHPLWSRYPFTELAEVKKNDIWLMIQKRITKLSKTIFYIHFF
jgi:hypothetical protein